MSSLHAIFPVVVIIIIITYILIMFFYFLHSSSFNWTIELGVWRSPLSAGLGLCWFSGQSVGSSGYEGE